MTTFAFTPVSLSCMNIDDGETMERCQTSERLATGVAAGMMRATGGASLTVLVVGGAVGAAVGSAVQGAGSKAVVEGSKNKQEILAAAKHGAEIGAIAGAVGAFGGAPFADTGTLGELKRGAIDAVVAEWSSILDTAAGVFHAAAAGTGGSERGEGKLPRMKSSEEGGG